MSLQFIIGSSGAGKSYFAYERVIRESMEHPERNYYIIVPEQFTMQTQKTLVEMMYSDKQQAFGQMKQQSLPTQCRECEWLFACNGECPKNRFARTASGEPGLNYLCKGYHRFFSHVAPYMDFMKNELMNQRPPANVMNFIKQ